MFFVLEVCFTYELNDGYTRVLFLIFSDICIDFLFRAQLVSQDFRVPMERKVQGYDHSCFHDNYIFVLSDMGSP